MNNYPFLKRSTCLLFSFFLFGCTAATNPSATNTRKKAEAYRELGVAYMQKDDFTSALRELMKSERLNPDDPYLQDYMGLAYTAKKRYDLAIEHFQKALSLKPTYTVAKNNLGNVYLYKREWDTAIEIFKEVAEDLIYPTPHYPLSNMGYAYYNKKNYALAESYYLKALDLEPKFVTALNGLGKTYIAMNKPDKAIELFEKAAALAPEKPDLYYSLGETYLLLGEQEKAKDAFEKVMGLDPDGSIARKARKMYDKLSQSPRW